jgi:hypothetical protein
VSVEENALSLPLCSIVGRGDTAREQPETCEGAEARDAHFGVNLKQTTLTMHQRARRPFRVSVLGPNPASFKSESCNATSHVIFKHQIKHSPIEQR